MTRKRAAGPAILGATLLAVVLALPSASAAACEDAYVYTYCGEHVPGSKLPLRFTYSSAGAPPQIAGDVRTTISSAMQTWNAAWPGSKLCTPLCLGGSGNSTIVWDDDLGSLPAAADLYYDPANSKRIARVRIVLNPNMTWRTAGGDDVAYGTASAATFGTVRNGNWYDLESVLLHELGHALGLEHIGDDKGAFPRNLVDSGRYMQVMYKWYYPGSVKRALGAGDIAGVNRVAADSYRD